MVASVTATIVLTFGLAVNFNPTSAEALHTASLCGEGPLRITASSLTFSRRIGRLAGPVLRCTASSKREIRHYEQLRHHF
jgi:hypothetical protein